MFFLKFLNNNMYIWKLFFRYVTWRRPKVATNERFKERITESFTNSIRSKMNQILFSSSFRNATLNESLNHSLKWIVQNTCSKKNETLCVVWRRREIATGAHYLHPKIERVFFWVLIKFWCNLCSLMTTKFQKERVELYAREF